MITAVLLVSAFLSSFGFGFCLNGAAKEYHRGDRVNCLLVALFNLAVVVANCAAAVHLNGVWSYRP